eukprot:SAG11_NODE_19672_length_461_cov_1.284530_1_plen_48_part_00
MTARLSSQDEETREWVAKRCSRPVDMFTDVGYRLVRLILYKWMAVSA